MKIDEAIRTIVKPKGTQYYLNGGCLQLATDLSRMYNGTIMYLPAYFHFVFSFDGKLYDATGNVSQKYSNEKKIRLKDVPQKILSGFKQD